MNKFILLFTTNLRQYHDYVSGTLKMDLETEIAKSKIEHICRVYRLKTKFQIKDHKKGTK